MFTNVIDFCTMVATFGAAFAAAYFAANANSIAKEQRKISEAQKEIERQQAVDAQTQGMKQTEIAEEQNKISAQQKEIESRQFEAEHSPALKFVVCAHFDEKKDEQQSDKEDSHPDEDETPSGYDLCVINYGKAPAVLTLLSKTQPENPNMPLARIKKNGLKGETGNPYEVLISDLPKDCRPTETPLSAQIGVFTKKFANSVIIMPQETKVFFKGKKVLSRVCNSTLSESKNHLNFFFAESVDQRRYWLSTEYTNDENLTLIQTIFENKPSGDKANA